MRQSCAPAESETQFEPGTLRSLVAPLADPRIGVAGGHTVYADPSGGSRYATLYLAYRRLEDRVRRLETRLGVGCKVDGPCAAAKRGFWRMLHDHEAEDQVLPLLARQAGLRTVHVDAARAHDVANSRQRQELTQRRRMTRKALLSFATSWSWANARAYPGFTAVYVSHKILRYFLPVFALLALIGALGMAAQAGVFWPAFLALLAAILISGFGAKIPKVWRLLGLPYSLLISNLADLLGIWDAFMRRAGGIYVPSRAIRSSKS